MRGILKHTATSSFSLLLIALFFCCNSKYAPTQPITCNEKPDPELTCRCVTNQIVNKRYIDLTECLVVRTPQFGGRPATCLSVDGVAPVFYIRTTENRGYGFNTDSCFARQGIWDNQLITYDGTVAADAPEDIYFTVDTLIYNTTRREVVKYERELFGYSDLSHVPKEPGMHQRVAIIRYTRDTLTNSFRPAILYNTHSAKDYKAIGDQVISTLSNNPLIEFNEVTIPVIFFDPDQLRPLSSN